jgi:hypothetical protein
MAEVVYGIGRNTLGARARGGGDQTCKRMRLETLERTDQGRQPDRIAPGNDALERVDGRSGVRRPWRRRVGRSHGPPWWRAKACSTAGAISSASQHTGVTGSGWR